MAVIRIPIDRTWGRSYKLDLAALAAGDKVATVSTTYGGLDATMWTVTKLTPTQVVAESTSHGRTTSARWRLRDGGKVGESYGGQLLDPADDEVLDALQVRALAQYKDRADRLLKAQFRTVTGQSARTTHQEKLAALAEVAELTAAVAEKLNALEAQRITEVSSGAA